MKDATSIRDRYFQSFHKNNSLRETHILVHKVDNSIQQLWNPSLEEVDIAFDNGCICPLLFDCLKPKILDVGQMFQLK